MSYLSHISNSGSSLKVVIAGGDSWYSLGDDAILSGTIQMLQQEFPQIKITILSERPDLTRKRYPNIDTIYRRNLTAILRLFRNSDLVLWGGGQLIQNISSHAFMVYQLTLVRLALLARVPIIGFSLGSAELKGKLWQFLIARTMNRLDALSVRDQKTYDDLVKIGVKREIDICADPALVLRADNEEVSNLPSNLNKPFVVIAPRIWFHFNYSVFPVHHDINKLLSNPGKFGSVLDGLAQAADWLVEKHKIGILFVGMYPRQGDNLVSAAIRERMRNPEASRLVQNVSSPKSMISLFSQSLAVMGIRLHSTILATCAGVPSINLYNQIKGLSYFNLLGLEQLAAPLDSVDQELPISLLELLLSDYQSIRDIVMVRREILTESSLGSIKLVRNVLDRN